MGAFHFNVSWDKLSVVPGYPSAHKYSSVIIITVVIYIISQRGNVKYENVTAILTMALLTAINVQVPRLP